MLPGTKALGLAAIPTFATLGSQSRQTKRGAAQEIAVSGPRRLARIVLADSRGQRFSVDMEAGRRSAPSNEEVAGVLDTMAGLYEAKGSRFRVRAYRDAAESVRHAERSVADIARERGEAGLRELPGVGRGIATTILEFVAAFPSSTLGSGRGGRAASTAARPLRPAHVLVAARHEHETRGAPVALLLDVDREYRKLAAEGGLRTIAPRLFNPQHEAWLPVMYTERGGWSFTAMFSNTARAHQLARTYDWVVLRYERDGREKQCTVVTERHGELAGLRVVRGHEAACRRYWAHHRPKEAA